MTAPYIAQRDAILVHAAAAAAAIDTQWKDVAIGAPYPSGNRCVRIFYAGEAEPENIPPQVLNARLIAEQVALVAYWSISEMTPTAIKAVDDEIVAFKHELRTRILGDSQLGGASTDLEMGFIEPDYVQIGGARWVTLECTFTLDFTEYPLGA